MLNYLKSEIYRIRRSKGIYVFIGGAMALMFAMNLVLWLFHTYAEYFPYGTTKFSFSMLSTGMQTVLCLTVLASIIVFGDEFKHRTISNGISFGCSKTMIFLCKWLITLLVCAIGLVLVVGTLIGSGLLLLENSGIEAIKNVLRAVVACIPLLIAGVTGALALIFLFRNEMTAVWVWLGIFVGSSMVVSLLGMKIELFSYLNQWLAFSIAGDLRLDEVAGTWSMVWDTKEGFVRTIFAGILGTLVFLVIGCIGTKKEK